MLPVKSHLGPLVMAGSLLVQLPTYSVNYTNSSVANLINAQ